MAYFSDLLIDIVDSNVLLSNRINESYVQTFCIKKDDFIKLIDTDFFENNEYKIKVNNIDNLVKLSIKMDGITHSFRIKYNEWIKCCSIFKGKNRS